MCYAGTDTLELKLYLTENVSITMMSARLIGHVPSRQSPSF
jgi:hypothetical protein